MASQAGAQPTGGGTAGPAHQQPGRRHLPLTCRMAGCTQQLRRSYNQTHRICPEHRKLLRIVAEDGAVWRFCLQCARLHTIDEFSGDRRSCQASLLLRRQRKRQRQRAEREDHEEAPRPGKRTKRPELQQAGHGSAGEPGKPAALQREGGWREARGRCEPQRSGSAASAPAATASGSGSHQSVPAPDVEPVARQPSAASGVALLQTRDGVWEAEQVPVGCADSQALQQQLSQVLSGAHSSLLSAASSGGVWHLPAASPQHGAPATRTFERCLTQGQGQQQWQQQGQQQGQQQQGQQQPAPGSMQQPIIVLLQLQQPPAQAPAWQQGVARHQQGAPIAAHAQNAPHAATVPAQAGVQAARAPAPLPEVHERHLLPLPMPALRSPRLALRDDPSLGLDIGSEAELLVMADDLGLLGTPNDAAPPSPRQLGGGPAAAAPHAKRRPSWEVGDDELWQLFEQQQWPAGRMTGGPFAR